MGRIGQILLLIAAVLGATPAAAAARAFIMVETADIGQSEAWYKKVFGLKRVNRFDRENFEQRILIGEEVIVELAQLKPASPKAAVPMLGIGKAGIEVADFDRKLAAWRAAGIAESKGLVFDEALGLATILLRDPDGNIVQIFGKSAGPFDVTVKVSADFTAE